MLPLHSENIKHPTCNIVIEKEGEAERVCGEFASQLVTLVDPANQSQVLAIVLVCPLHDQALDEGKSLVVVSEDGKERIAVQYVQHKEEE